MQLRGRVYTNTALGNIVGEVSLSRRVIKVCTQRNCLPKNDPDTFALTKYMEEVCTLFVTNSGAIVVSM